MNVNNTAMPKAKNCQRWASL